MDREATAREYYRTLDEDDYETLADLLAPDFVHYRPDRTIEGRDQFVTFMRDERPMKATSHPLDGVYSEARSASERASSAERSRSRDGDAVSRDDENSRGEFSNHSADHSSGQSPREDGERSDPRADDGDVAVRGRLLDPDGEPVVSFVDVFAFDGENVQSIHTYTQA